MPEQSSSFSLIVFCNGSIIYSLARSQTANVIFDVLIKHYLPDPPTRMAYLLSGYPTRKAHLSHLMGAVV